MLSIHFFCEQSVFSAAKFSYNTEQTLITIFNFQIKYFCSLKLPNAYVHGFLFEYLSKSIDFIRLNSTHTVNGAFTDHTLAYLAL